MNASIISSSWVRLIYVEFCEITRAITTKSEHTDHWTKMLRPFALFSGSVPSRHIRSSAGFTITTCVFEFSVYTGRRSCAQRNRNCWQGTLLPKIRMVIDSVKNCEKRRLPCHSSGAVVFAAVASALGSGWV